jgi:drug/metabolite transporter (DMT)-like permease
LSEERRAAAFVPSDLARVGIPPREEELPLGMGTRIARRDVSHGWLVWVALWTVYIVWGSTYLAIRITVETLPPFVNAGFRFLVAGAVMYGFLAFRRGRAAMSVTPRQLAASSLVGACLVVGGNGLVVIAEQTVPSGLASLIIASVPLWVVLFRTVTGDRVSVGTLGGVGAGFAGVAMLVLPGDKPEGVTIGGLLLLVLASASWAFGSFTSTKLEMPKDPFVSTALQSLAGGIILLIGGALRGEFSGLDVAEFSTASMLAWGYLVVFGSLTAFTAYVWLLQHAPISKVATYAYVNPMIALVLGWLILSEEITVTMLVGAAIIVASVAGTVRRESRKQPAPDEEGVEPTPAMAGADP